MMWNNLRFVCALLAPRLNRPRPTISARPSHLATSLRWAIFSSAGQTRTPVNSVGETSLTCPIQQMLFEDNAAGQIRAMQFLLDHGAKVDGPDAKGNTPLISGDLLTEVHQVHPAARWRVPVREVPLFAGL